MIGLELIGFVHRLAIPFKVQVRIQSIFCHGWKIQVCMKKWLLDWFFLCYELWRFRKKHFEGIALPNPVNCVNQANRNVNMFNQSNATVMQQQNLPILLHESNIRWIPPPAGWYKLNVDAAGLTSDGVWGLTAVIETLMA